MGVCVYVYVYVYVCMYYVLCYVFSDSDFNNTVDKHVACAACSCYDETDR